MAKEGRGERYIKARKDALKHRIYHKAQQRRYKSWDNLRDLLKINGQRDDEWNPEGFGIWVNKEKDYPESILVVSDFLAPLKIFYELLFENGMSKVIKKGKSGKPAIIHLPVPITQDNIIKHQIFCRHFNGLHPKEQNLNMVKNPQKLCTVDGQDVLMLVDDIVVPECAIKPLKEFVAKIHEVAAINNSKNPSEQQQQKYVRKYFEYLKSLLDRKKQQEQHVVSEEKVAAEEVIRTYKDLKDLVTKLMISLVDKSNSVVRTTLLPLLKDKNQNDNISAEDMGYVKDFYREHENKFKDVGKKAMQDFLEGERSVVAGVAAGVGGI